MIERKAKYCEVKGFISVQQDTFQFRAMGLMYFQT